MFSADSACEDLSGCFVLVTTDVVAGTQQRNVLSALLGCGVPAEEIAGLPGRQMSLSRLTRIAQLVCVASEILGM